MSKHGRIWELLRCNFSWIIIPYDTLNCWQYKGAIIFFLLIAHAHSPGVRTISHATETDLSGNAETDLSISVTQRELAWLIVLSSDWGQVSNSRRRSIRSFAAELALQIAALRLLKFTRDGSHFSFNEVISGKWGLPYLVLTHECVYYWTCSRNSLSTSSYSS